VLFDTESDKSRHSKVAIDKPLEKILKKYVKKLAKDISGDNLEIS
jgi:hypothetical protein